MNTTFSKNFGWEIERHPISFEREGELITSPDFQILSRSDNNQVLSVMSKRYCPMSVNQFEEASEKMQKASGMELLGYQEFNEGRVLLAILKNGNPLEVNSYPIEDYLVLGTSFNGAQPFFIGTSTILVRCQNSFSQIHMLSRTKHTTHSYERRESVLNGLEYYFNSRKKLYSNLELMQNVPITDETKKIFVNSVLSLPNELPEETSTRTLNRINELYGAIDGETSELGNNLFGLFQGLTKFTTHTLRTKNEAPFGNLIGTANDLNQKGYDFALSMMRAA